MKYPDFLKEFVVKFPMVYGFLEWSGIKRDSEVSTFFQKVHKGEVVFDIGANVGRFTKLFCMLTGKGGKVIAFEPVAINFNKLMQLNFKNLVVYKLALSDKSGTSTLYYPPNDGAQASMVKQTFGNWRTSVTVGEEICEMDSLDGLMETKQLPTPHFIKIDAEGAELRILMGANKLLMNGSITVFLELNTETLKSFGISIGQIWNLLHSYGYTTFTLVARKTSFRVETQLELERGVEQHFSPNLLCQKSKK